LAYHPNLAEVFFNHFTESFRAVKENQEEKVFFCRSVSRNHKERKGVEPQQKEGKRTI
jgi:hypothetical protein